MTPPKNITKRFR